MPAVKNQTKKEEKKRNRFAEKRSSFIVDDFRQTREQKSKLQHGMCFLHIQNKIDELAPIIYDIEK